MPVDSTAVASWSETFGLIETILTVIAIILGAAWAWFKYFRSRTFTKRLNPLVTARIQRSSGRSLLAVDIEIANVGLTDVVIKQSGTGLRLCLNEPLVSNGDDEAQEVKWKWIATIPILSDHGSVEPGETLREQHILILPSGTHDAVRSELIVVSDKLMWSATGVTTTEQPSG